MMTSSNGNIFCVTGPLCGEFTGHWFIPLKKASDAHTALMFFICIWTNGRVNNRDDGDLRHHRAHYDVIVIIIDFLSFLKTEITQVNANSSPLKTGTHLSYGQYHGWWCPGDARRRDISSYVIDLVFPETSSLGPRGVDNMCVRYALMGWLPICIPLPLFSKCHIRSSRRRYPSTALHET